MLLAAGREIEVVLRRGRASSRRCDFTPDLIEKYHAADLGVRPMLHMRLGTVYAGEPAEKAGLKTGDVVLAINGASSDAATAVEAFKTNVGKPLTLRVRRDGAERDFVVTPVAKDGKAGRIGVDVALRAVHGAGGGLPRRRAPQLRAQPRVGRPGLQDAARPVPRRGVAQAAHRLHRHRPGVRARWPREGAAALFRFMAMLSMNLAILNLLPIPMLDGGHIFIMLLEGLARRDFSLRAKERLLMAGFVLVMTLMVTVIYNDLMRIEWIEKLVPWR